MTGYGASPLHDARFGWLNPRMAVPKGPDRRPQSYRADMAQLRGLADQGKIRLYTYQDPKNPTNLIHHAIVGRGPSHVIQALDLHPSEHRSRRTPIEFIAMENLRPADFAGVTMHFVWADGLGAELFEQPVERFVQSFNGFVYPVDSAKRHQGVYRPRSVVQQVDWTAPFVASSRPSPEPVFGTRIVMAIANTLWSQKRHLAAYVGYHGLNPPVWGPLAHLSGANYVELAKELSLIRQMMCFRPGFATPDETWMDPIPEANGMYTMIRACERLRTLVDPDSYAGGLMIAEWLEEREAALGLAPSTKMLLESAYSVFLETGRPDMTVCAADEWRQQLLGDLPFHVNNVGDVALRLPRSDLVAAAVRHMTGKEPTGWGQQMQPPNKMIDEMDAVVRAVSVASNYVAQAGMAYRVIEKYDLDDLRDDFVSSHARASANVARAQPAVPVVDDVFTRFEVLAVDAVIRHALDSGVRPVAKMDRDELQRLAASGGLVADLGAGAIGIGRQQDLDRIGETFVAEGLPDLPYPQTVLRRAREPMTL